MSRKLCEKLRNLRAEDGKFTCVPMNRHLLAANATAIDITNRVETEVKLNGLTVPIACEVAEGLTYDLILGMDFLQDTQAVIDITANTLTLYGGMLTLPMTKVGNDITVFTTSSVTIPPNSETLIPVSTSSKPRQSLCVLEQSSQLPCRSLLVARALVDTAQHRLPCRLMNPTDRTITLRTRTPIGVLSPVASVQAVESLPPPDLKTLPTLAEMKSEIESKGIMLADTAVKGQDFDRLVTLLYANKDLMATSLLDLPGTDIMLHRIDTGDSPPIRTRQFRHSPSDRAEIARQVQEMLTTDFGPQ
jgi:hypothetical protein